MRAIFISYRREDTEGQAGRLFDDLIAHFGERCVFMDVAGIEPGQDFRKVIDQHLANCGVLLALIGKQWVDVKDASGQRRLDNPLDFVRLETASALKRDIPVIPVLVQNASMPRAEQLPGDVAELAYRNSVELTHARWDSDVKFLINALGSHVHAKPKSALSAEGHKEIDPHPHRRAPLIAIAVASIVAIALIVFAGADEVQRRQTEQHDNTSLIAEPETAVESAQTTPSVINDREQPNVQTVSTGSCADGFVERRAYEGDSVCVSESSARRAADDNRNAPVRWQSGAYGDKTCVSGYVWRVARPDDLVCVLPTTRDETALENQQVTDRDRRLSTRARAAGGRDHPTASYSRM